jgi:hypothetical protein
LQPDPVSFPPAQDARAVADDTAEVEISVPATEPEITPSFAPTVEPLSGDAMAMRPRQRRRNLIQKVRDWLRRAA